jgi:AraC family transcriptional regulator
MTSVSAGIDAGDSWRTARWPIALETPPEVVSTGLSLHGQHGAEQYLLPDLWSLHLYSYSAALQLGDLSLPIRPGYIGLTPPNMLAHYDFHGPSPHLYVHFRCGASASDAPAGDLIPAMQDAGDDFERLSRQLERTVRGIGVTPSRRQACVWALLCELVDLTQPTDEAAIHPAVRHAVAEIELHLGEPLSATGLARSADVSYSHLARLFQDAFGTSVVSYLRARRVQQAEHMLRHSTLPIKVIAAQVGLADLHFFNKTIRHHLGRSPRQVRAGQS